LKQVAGAGVLVRATYAACRAVQRSGHVHGGAAAKPSRTPSARVDRAGVEVGSGAG